jgi:hypothetical protein
MAFCFKLSGMMIANLTIIILMILFMCQTQESKKKIL